MFSKVTTFFSHILVLGIPPVHLAWDLGFLGKVRHEREKSAIYSEICQNL